MRSVAENYCERQPVLLWRKPIPVNKAMPSATKSPINTAAAKSRGTFSVGSFEVEGIRITGCVEVLFERKVVDTVVFTEEVTVVTGCGAKIAARLVGAVTLKSTLGDVESKPGVEDDAFHPANKNPVAGRTVSTIIDS